MKLQIFLAILPAIYALKLKTMKAASLTSKWSTGTYNSPAELPQPAELNDGSDFRFHFTEDAFMYVQGKNSRGSPLIVGKSSILPGYTKNASNPIFLNFDSNGQLSVQDSEGQTLRDLVMSNQEGFGTENGPFVATVDYDRKFRIRNAYDTIMMEFPSAPRRIQNLDSTGMNFISGLESISSPDGKWSISITKKGQIVTNAGYAFNNVPSSDLNEPRILILESNGGLKFYNAFRMPINIKGFPTGIDVSNQRYTAEITVDGLFQIMNQDGNQVWSFDIKATAPQPTPSSTTTTTTSTTPTAASSTPAPPAPTPLPLQWIKDDDFYFAKDADFVGHDVYQRHGSFEDCKDHCSNDADCTHFSSNGNTCYIKNRAYGLDGAESRPNSGEIAAMKISKNDALSHPVFFFSNKAVLGRHCDWPGNDISYPQVDFESCKKMCDDNDQCTHYSWQTPHNCNLKKQDPGVSLESASFMPTIGFCGLSSQIEWAEWPNQGITWSYQCDFKGIGDYDYFKSDSYVEGSAGLVQESSVNA